MKRIFVLFLLIFVFISGYAQHLKKDGTPDMRYKENKQSYPSNTYSNQTYQSTGTHLKKDGTSDKRYKENKTDYNYSVPRDNKGKIKRSSSAKHEFMKESGYAKGRPGYVVDHIVPLKKGGCDCPSNMQWQTVDEAKQKDKVEEP